MEISSTPTDRDAANDALHALAADRAALARRAAAPRWLYPVLGLVVAGQVATPGVGDWALAAVLFAVSAVLSALIEVAYRRARGLASVRMPGVASVLTLTALAVIVLLLLAASLVVTVLDLRLWIVLTSALGFASVVGGGALFERVYGEELRLRV